MELDFEEWRSKSLGMSIGDIELKLFAETLFVGDCTIFLVLRLLSDIEEELLELEVPLLVPLLTSGLPELSSSVVLISNWGESEEKESSRSDCRSALALSQ